MIESVLQIIVKCLPFIAIGFLILALLVHKRMISAPGWIFIAGYCYFEATEYLAIDEYFDASLVLVVLAFSLILAFIMLGPTLSERREEDSLYTLTKIALIAAVFYFPFAEIPFLGDLLIFITAEITAIVLNLFNVGVYVVPPSCIYTTDSSFHVVYLHQPITIILACTAIQGMVIFIGLIFGVKAPIRRKLKAFFVSVPVIYALNISRDAFVSAAYFELWFGPPQESFFITHNVIARIFALFALIAIAYAVFVILPEALEFVEDFFAALKSSFRVHKAI
ncbi:MAG TPA: archaeosortase A [Methanophagales archaeon]|nr:archaeosortase A [Methanophagales archaeon]